MKTIPEEVDAPVSVVDDDGKRYEGTFTLKTSLSSKEESAVGRMRRAILGPVPIASSGDQLDYMYASWQADLNVRALKSPEFWTKSEGGDRLSRTVLGACGEAADKALGEIRAQREAAGKAAQEQIRKSAEGAK